MGLATVVTVDGVAYNAAQRAAAMLLPTGLDRTLEGGYDTFTFHELPTTPAPTYTIGAAVTVAIDVGDGAGSVTRFSGVIVDVQDEFGPYGWGHGYTCLGLKHLADRVPVTAIDGTGTAVYNRTPLDEYYSPGEAGLELGEIFRRILTVPATAQALHAHGIGDYTGLPSVPTLPAATLADLARLDVVPPRPVIFRGESLFNTMDQELTQWMPRFFSAIEPDGVIRFRDVTSAADFAPRTITCPSASGPGDPVTTPRVQSSTKACATRIILRGGPQVEVAILSLADGTLAEVFTAADKDDWDLTYFTAPKGATDAGDVVAVTSTSATLRSDDATATWPANFWADNQATIQLIDPLASGISQLESRLATSNDALAAGGTSTVNWDGSWPITATAYTRYRITGGAGGLVDTWRTYTPREPATGATGLATYVGSHLVTRSAHPVRVANADQTFHAHFTTAVVQGGSLGQQFPLGIQAVPSEGIFRFTQPTVTVFGSPGALNAGSPTTVAQGLPSDVIVYALYSRGALAVVAPPDVGGLPQYSGTAHADHGVEVTRTLEFPAWLWANDAASFQKLAGEMLASMSDTEVDLEIAWYFTPAGPVPGWDFLTLGYRLNVAIAGQTSPWSALAAPIRSVGLRWDWTGRSPGTAVATFSCSTRRRPFAGFDLYIHPEFARGTPLEAAFTSENSRGNLEDYSALIGPLALPGRLGTPGGGNYREWASRVEAGGAPGAITAGDVIAASGMPASGFTLGDVAAAGMVPPSAPRRRRDAARGEPGPPPGFVGPPEAEPKMQGRLGDEPDQWHWAGVAEREDQEVRERKAIEARNAAKPAELQRVRDEGARKGRIRANQSILGRIEAGRLAEVRKARAAKERAEIDQRNRDKAAREWEKQGED
jgi:hypothetical protein